jgi:hypothetical protein
VHDDYFKAFVSAAAFCLSPEQYCNEDIDDIPWDFFSHA